jgi:glucose-6-phosphate isomerase
MNNLTISGLPLSWDRKQFKLVFGPGMDEVEPALRRVKEMQEVLYRGEGDDLVFEDDPDRILYYMYRDVHLREDSQLFISKGIRYDVTILMPGNVGQEYVKTAGHYHPLKPGTVSTYPEVYEVLLGKAHYLIQKPVEPSEPEKGLEQVKVFIAEPGDKVLIPPGFGHITINPENDFLVMSNLVAREFSSVYEPLEKMKGAGYFQLSAEGKEPLFVPNPHCPSLPSLQICYPTDQPAISLLKDLPLYRAFLKNPDHFIFLTRPEAVF